MANDLPVAVVVGVGAGLGAALARRFAAGYRVALIARKADYLDQLARTITTDDGVRLPEMRVIEAMAGG